MWVGLLTSSGVIGASQPASQANIDSEKPMDHTTFRLHACSYFTRILLDMCMYGYMCMYIKYSRRFSQSSIPDAEGGRRTQRMYLPPCIPFPSMCLLQKTAKRKAMELTPYPNAASQPTSKHGHTSATHSSIQTQDKNSSLCIPMYTPSLSRNQHRHYNPSLLPNAPCCASLRARCDLVSLPPPSAPIGNPPTPVSTGARAGNGAGSIRKGGGLADLSRLANESAEANDMPMSDHVLFFFAGVACPCGSPSEPTVKLVENMSERELRGSDSVVGLKNCASRNCTGCWDCRGSS